MSLTKSNSLKHFSYFFKCFCYSRSMARNSPRGAPYIPGAKKTFPKEIPMFQFLPLNLIKRLFIKVLFSSSHLLFL